MADYSSHLNIPYLGASSPRLALDLFLPSSACSSSPLLVWIHGGAWRSEAKEDFTDTLVPSLVRHTQLPIAVLEYRLAPADPHPAQILDVLAGLSLLSSPELLPLEKGSARWSRQSLILAGHSAGAFMAAELVLRPPPSASPSFAVPLAVRQSILTVICIDGIYDLPELLDENPSYHYFVDDAFGTDAKILADESPARWEVYDDEAARKVRFLVLHSKDDELLSLRQSRVFVRRLKELLGGMEVGEGDKEAEQRLPATVEVDFDSLKGTHQGLLKREELPRAIARWVR
ncbi:hypothetical protein JCM21900_001322 [Sporobolomyces salmonicolor]